MFKRGKEQHLVKHQNLNGGPPPAPIPTVGISKDSVIAALTIFCAGFALAQLPPNWHESRAQHFELDLVRTCRGITSSLSPNLQEIFLCGSCGSSRIARIQR